MKIEDSSTKKIQKAIFGAGCFWCVEAVFQSISGVKKVTSGYAGGEKKNPSYEEICTGQTGHAEVCQLEFEPDTVSYTDLLHVFWNSHDPTTLNQQGNDIGSQYRSVIFYYDLEQKNLAFSFKEALEAKKTFSKVIVTEISPLDEFFPAEIYHQDYYKKNSNQSYCAYVIRPKLEKLSTLLS